MTSAPPPPTHLLAWAIQETHRAARQIASVAQVLLAIRDAANSNGPGTTAPRASNAAVSCCCSRCETELRRAPSEMPPFCDECGERWRF
jgi:hypothetical protein